MKYQFAAFTYDLDQKILSRGSTPLVITKKNHELLHYLLTNPKRMISRDELIDHVWGGRVVTNNTIDQCILKLRKALNQVHQGEYIESVYGQGIRFLPKITIENGAKNNNTMKTAWIIGAIVSLSLVLVWIYTNNQHKFSNDFTTSSSPTNVISQSTLQTNKPEHFWITKGATGGYLSHLIQQYPKLKATNARVVYPTTTELPNIVIELVQPETSGLILTMNIDSIMVGTTNDSNYQVGLIIKDKDAVLNSTSITANQLSVLFPKVAAWVNQQLDGETINKPIDPHVFTDDELALRNYFRAQSAQSEGDSQQAITYLQTAVEEDPEFKMAWYEMAVALRKQADPRKALAILNAIKSDDHNFAYRVALVKGHCFDTLGEFNSAEAAYQQALKHAEFSESDEKSAAIYISQAILWRKTKQHKKAEQALQMALNATNAQYQPQLYGTIMSTYAKLAREMNKPLVAIEKAEQAIAAFQRSGDLRYQMQTKTALASILRQRNEFTQVEKLVKESLFHAEQLKHRRGISDNRTKLARLYQQTGRFRLAHEQWQLVLKLNAELKLFGNTADAYFWILKLHIAENNMPQADIDLKMLQQLHNEHPSQEILNLLNEAQLIMALQQADIDSGTKYLGLLEKSEHRLMHLYQGDLSLLKGKKSAAEEHYLKAYKKFKDSGRFDLITIILNRLNSLYVDYEPQKLALSLKKTSELKPFIYPLHKFKAQAALVSGQNIKALSILEELKLKAGDYWNHQDELFLKELQHQ